MTLMNRLGLLSMILFFSGSMVFVAARDLQRDHLRRKDAIHDQDRAKQLVHALQGDVLRETQDKYVPSHSFPSRAGSSVLPEADKSRIKSFLRSLIGSEEPKESAAAAPTQEK
jgi:hypothetical protein